MTTDHIDALWDFFTSGRTKVLVEQLRAVPHDEALAVLGISEAGPSSTASAARYFTVQLQAQGRTQTMHLEAMDIKHAGNTALARKPSAISAEVVREINRDEFERLTRKST